MPTLREDLIYLVLVPTGIIDWRDRHVFRRLQGGVLGVRERLGVWLVDRLLDAMAPRPPRMPREIRKIVGDVLERKRRST